MCELLAGRAGGAGRLGGMNFKEAVGEAAAREVGSGMKLGLGTGSTADFFLIALGRECRSGKLGGVCGVPTSERSAARSRELGIPLTTLTETPALDLAVDGADEIAPGLALIKGLGGALLREKIVAQAAATFLVIADHTKLSPRLGLKSPLPVEVTPFEHASHVRFFRSLGCDPVLRKAADGKTYMTDNGNVIYDLKFAAGIDDPAALELRLLKHAGVVETGLFLGIAKRALIAKPEGVEEIKA